MLPITRELLGGVALVVAGCSTLAGIKDDFHTVGDAAAGSAGTGTAGAEGGLDASLEAGDGGECAPGNSRCVGAALETCSQARQWGAPVACDASMPVCYNGQCISNASCKVGGPELKDCGPKSENCCTNSTVVGGTFYRSYDGVGFTEETAPATVATFRLDKYEITVGRFRRFVDAWAAGWRPAEGAGKHAYLNGGKGLVSDDGKNETGWDPSWNAELPGDKSQWDTALQCYSPGGPWTPEAGANERRPIECENWYEAYAFCIWDGGFLPSEAEWNYAAAGGARGTTQRQGGPSSACILGRTQRPRRPLIALTPTT